MAKRIMAKTGSYQKDGQTKNKYTEIGVIMENQNGEYVLLDPTVDLAGVMMLQRIQSGKGEKVICSIFSDDNQRRAPQSHQAPARDSLAEDEIPF